jgi:metallophosphoesterase superfamily enzyme
MGATPQWTADAAFRPGRIDVRARSRFSEDYRPETFVLLGDIVERAVQVEELKSQLNAIVSELSRRSRLVLVRGNHDVSPGTIARSHGSIG